LGKFTVIQLNVKRFFENKTIKDGIKDIKKTIINEVKGKNQDFQCDEEKTISRIIYEIHKCTYRKIVLIIDDWDFVLQDNKYGIDSITYYLNFLILFTKDNGNIALSYMTGVLPIKNLGTQTSLGGVFKENSMISPYKMAEYIGFNDSDIKELCQKHLNEKILENSYENQIPIHKNICSDKEAIITMNFEMINDWYSCYRLENKGKNEESYIYTPYSVIKAIENNEIKNYWTKTDFNFTFS